MGKLGDALVVGLIAVVSGALLAVGLYGLLLGVGFDADDNPVVATLLFVPGAAIVIWIAVAQHRRSERRAKEYRQAQDAAVAAERAAERSSAIDRLLMTAEQAKNQFSWMPVRLQEAAQAYERAQNAYRDGAYSPFWSAVEAGYIALAMYVQAAEQVAVAARNHATTVAAFARDGGIDPRLAPFPVQVDSQRVREQHGGVLSKLDAITYEAQRQSTFAVIWEQRRNTTAVIQGFANLESAVHSMGSRVTNAIGSMSSQLAESNAQITTAIHSQNAAAAAASSAQLEQARRLTTEAEAIKEHLYYPELSRWLR